MPKVDVQISLTLSDEQVELLDRYGPLIVDLVDKLIRQARFAKQHLDLEDHQAEYEARCAEREQAFERLGRSAYRLFRTRMVDAPRGKAQVNARAKFQRNQIAEIADQVRDDPMRVELAIKMYRRRLRAAIKVRRERHILDHLYAGENNVQIAEALGLKKHIVDRAVCDLRAEARSLGISIYDLRDRKAPGVPS